jgi:hypothetical protein
VSARYTPGTRVKPSAYALRSRRDHYLDASGAERDKRKRWHDTEAARRGTVTVLLPDQRGIASPGVEVTWDGGAVSRCLDYMLEPA